MWDTDIQLVVKIFQQIIPLEEVETPVEYLERHKHLIAAAGRELEFLQLAMPDNKSPLGWRPTPLLMKFMAKRRTAKKAKPLYPAAIMFNLLADYVNGYSADRGQSIILSDEILLAAGLLVGDDDEYFPYVTRRLHNLFCAGYFAKREGDGLSEFFLGRYQVHQRRRATTRISGVADFTAS
jgi:hypothetical protein